MDTRERPTARVPVLMEPSLAAALQEAAAEHDRSVSAEARTIIRRSLEKSR